MSWRQAKNAADELESRRVSQRANKPADHHEVAHRLQPRAFLVALGPETNGLVRQRRVATVAHRCGHKVRKPGGNVDCLYCRLACVQRTTYDVQQGWTMLQADNVANGRRHKWITNCVLRALHRRATPTEDCGQGARGVRMSVQQYNMRTTGHKEPRTYRKDRHDAEIGDGGDGLDGAMAMAKANANANMNVDVDVLGGGLTSSGRHPRLASHMTSLTLHSPT